MSVVSRAGLLALVGLLVATSVHADVCVDPTDGDCEATIQAGVDAADPGDTIDVYPGFYNENVVVPATKPGIEIIGHDYPVLDPEVEGPPGTFSSLPGIKVDAVDVRIEKLYFQNGRAEGSRSTQTARM